jgi:hypothetical protein
MGNLARHRRQCRNRRANWGRRPSCPKPAKLVDREAEAEEGGERQCEGAFSWIGLLDLFALASAEGVQHPGMPLVFLVEGTACSSTR